MAVSKETFCHDLLHRWQIRMLEDVWNFNQVANIETPSYEGVYLQHERELIAHGLAEAFDIVTDALGYYPKPVYIVDKQIKLDPKRAYWAQEFKLYTRYLQAFGTRATTLIDADAAPSYSDIEDGDSINDLATFTVSSAIDVSEIQVFYRVADGAPSAAHRQWRIPTLAVTASSGTVTIKVHRANLVKPSVWSDPWDTNRDRNAADISNASTDFVEGVDVYRVYTDSTSAIRLLSLPTVSGETTVVETAVEPIITDAKYCEFRLSDDANPPNTPYAIKVSFLAGLDLGQNGEMDSPIEKALIKLCNVVSQLSATPLSQRTEYFWTEDMETLFASEYDVPREYVNPFGLRRGHIDAWLTLKRYADGLTSKTKVRRTW